MKIVVGLGNPGEKYGQTRHNAGFMFVDFLAEKLSGGEFSFHKKSQAEVLKFGDLLLAKPQTFMNDSGRSVQGLINFFGGDDFELEQLVVAHDDLDLAVGEFQFRLSKGPKIHNGLLSIYQHLDSQEFWHLRLGVDGRQGERSQSGRDYVLGRFSPVEKGKMQQAFISAEEKLRAELLLN
jgi:PTH1 family peptidyl-tRNA hydrolase